MAFRGNGLRDVDGLRELAFAEEGVGEIEFDVVGIGIGFCGGLEMFDRVVVETIACEKDADASLHAEIFGADLIELGDGAAGVFHFS